ncbi:MAG: GNAT family N-acetyltransferase [Brumimicrobium sp.]
MTKSDKQRIIEILAASFRENKSTNFVIKQDRKREARLRKLIEYSIFYGNNFGKIYLSGDRNSCAIVLDTEKKKTTFLSILWDLRLVFKCIGAKNIGKVLKRESLIKAHHPKDGFIHLWYIGVIPSEQGKGLGTKLINQVIANAKSEDKAIYLETSTERNFAYYKNLGFKETSSFDQLGYSIKMFTLN